jgi:hypothetical protein
VRNAGLGPVIAVAGAIIAAVLTYAVNQRAARRERRAKAFAEALATIEEYAEMPYRIRRRRDASMARYDLTDHISDIQARLAYHQALLQLEAPNVANAYAGLVRATKIQAGTQMQDAWTQPLLLDDAAMNLRIRYPRDQIDAARAVTITAMRSAISPRGPAFTLPTANSDSVHQPPGPRQPKPSPDPGSTGT